MIIDAHMHIWDRIHGLVNGELPVRPLGSGMISIGEEKMLGMPAILNECQALAEYVIGEFDASGVQAGVVVQEYLDGPKMITSYLFKVIIRTDFFCMHCQIFSILMELYPRLKNYLTKAFAVSSFVVVTC